MLPYEFCKIVKNNYFEEQVRTAASVLSLLHMSKMVEIMRIYTLA